MSGLRSSPRIDWMCERQSISAKWSEMSTDENHRRAHMTLSARKICDVFVTSFNPFTAKFFPFDEKNRLALDRVKSIKSLLGVKGLRDSF